jgi:hypothetical protein
MEKFLQRKLVSTAYTVEKLRYPELPSIILHNIRGKLNKKEDSNDDSKK